MTAVLVAVLSAGDRRAHADDAAPPPGEGVGVAAPPRRPRPTADLDGLYLWVGPTGAAIRIDGGWDSAWGGGVQVLRVRERAAIATVGVWIGVVHYAARDGGRLWVEAVAGTRRVGGRMLGVSAGPAIELAASRHPRLGGAVTAWWFAGVTPYVRAGALVETGAFAELGVSISLPAWRH